MIMFKEYFEMIPWTEENRDTFFKELLTPENYIEYDKETKLPIGVKYDGKHTKEELIENIMIAYTYVTFYYKIKDKNINAYVHLS